MSDHKTSYVKYTLQVTGHEVKFVGDVKYEEQLNSPYELSVYCSLEIPHDENVAGINRQLRHTDVTLRLEREGEEATAMEIHGLIANSMYAFSPGDVTDDEVSDERRGFDLEVVPAFALLEHHKNKPQAWHDKTYAQVLEEVLAEELAVYGRKVDNRAVPGPVIPLITRSPGESALQFAKRLMFESGINSFFDFEGGGAGKELLVLGDSNAAFTPAKLPEAEPISMLKSEGTSFISKVKFVANSGSSSTEYSGFDPVQTPTLNISETATSDSSMPAAAQELRWTKFRHGAEGSADGPAKVAAERHAERAQTSQFSTELETSILGALPGRSLPLDDGTKVIDHIATSTSFEGGNGKFMAKTTVTPVRTPDGQDIAIRAPVESPPPASQGVSLARIASSGAAVDSDGQLWCKIRFVWDTTGKDEPTTRAPVLQPMAGSFGGTQWIPRKGDVVVVAFLEGSRENPVIIGCQYDKDQSPLHIGPADTPGHMVSVAKAGAGQQLPASDTWLGWSYSSIAGSRPSSNARTMFAMNVAEGSEMLYLNAPGDYRLDTTRNADVWTKGSSTHNVAMDHVEEVGGKYEQKVTGNRTEEVTGNYELKVTGNSSLNLGKGGTMSSDGNMQLAANALIRCQSNAFRIDAASISFSTRPSVGGGAGGAATDYAGLSLKRRADLAGPEAAALVSGPSTVEAGARKVLLDGPAIELKEGSGSTAKLENGKFVIDAPQGITLRCGKSEIRITPEGIEIDADDLKIKSSSATVDAKNVKLEGDRLNVDVGQAKINADRLDIAGEGGGE